MFDMDASGEEWKYRIVSMIGNIGILPPISREISRLATGTILSLCEGQGDELMKPAGRNPLDVERYVSICERKTGEAFALAAQLGALAAGADDAPFRRYGLAYGVLFQINDDLSDGEAPADLLELKRRYEDETAFHRDQCAIGVW